MVSSTRRAGGIFTSVILSFAAPPLLAAPPAQLLARIEYVAAENAFAYQSTTGQLIEQLASSSADRPAQLLANTATGLGFLYLSSVQSAQANERSAGFWQGWAGSLDPDRAAQADGFVANQREMLLSYRADLSYRPPASRVEQQDRRYLAFFIYGIPRDQRVAFEAMSSDYNDLCRERGVTMWSETYEITGEGDELRFLIVKTTTGAPDFWRSEAELDAAIRGERFEQIGMLAEAMISSVEFMSAVPLSEGLSPHPLLRD